MVIDREHQGADALQIYLREMAETPLLTPQEEIALAKRVKPGDEKARARMIKATHLPPPPQNNPLYPPRSVQPVAHDSIARPHGRAGQQTEPSQFPTRRDSW